MRKYMENPDYTFEKINKASLACGPLVKWAIAQVSYVEMLRRVEPLRQELLSVEEEKSVNQAKVSNPPFYEQHVRVTRLLTLP